MSKEYEEAARLLPNILPQYKRISEAPTDGELDNERYKSVARDGSIWLIANPAAWVEKKNPDGSFTRYRPKPEFMMSLAQARKAAADAKKTTDIEITPTQGVKHADTDGYF